MNTWQVLKQLQNLLLARAWTEAPSNNVFGAVRVSSGPTETGLGQLRFPFAVLSPADGSADSQEPRLTTQNVDVRMAVRSASDPFGEHALMGGPREEAQGSSNGRGLLEIEEELLATIGDLQERNGVRLRVVYKSVPKPVQDATHGYVILRDYRIELWVTTLRSYEACTRLTAVDQTGGNVLINWTLPASRYDRREVILRRASGAVPPSSQTDGTGVTLASLLATSVTDSPGAGMFSYALFAGYDELLQGASDRFSAAATVTVTVT